MWDYISAVKWKLATPLLGSSLLLLLKEYLLLYWRDFCRPSQRLMKLKMDKRKSEMWREISFPNRQVTSERRIYCTIQISNDFSATVIIRLCWAGPDDLHVKGPYYALMDFHFPVVCVFFGHVHGLQRLKSQSWENVHYVLFKKTFDGKRETVTEVTFSKSVGYTV